MNSRQRLDDDFAEETLTDYEVTTKAPADQPSQREICFLDFKDGRTDVTVTHGPVDPSRIWLTLRSGDAVLQVTVEEQVARKIADGLGAVLPTFRAVRADLRRT